MHLIDAAAALRIKEADAIEQAFRAGRIRMWGLHGEQAVEHELILPERVPDLEVRWHARPSRRDDQLGEADLVTPFNGRVLPYEPVWLNLRFSQEEVESLVASEKPQRPLKKHEQVAAVLRVRPDLMEARFKVQQDVLLKEYRIRAGRDAIREARRLVR
jgi:hypothetical protein